MNEPIRILVYDPREGFDEVLPKSAITPAEWVANTPGWKPDLLETLVWFDGPEPLAISPFGRLDQLPALFDEAADCLAAGQFALLRTTGDWAAIFIVLEPGADYVDVSALHDFPASLESYYPLAVSPFHPVQPVNQKKALRTYVAAHRCELQPRREDGGVQWRMQNLRWPLMATIHALRAHAVGARALLTHIY